MDTLCDELLQEIFHRLPQPSAAAVSLVCRRWRRLLRLSTASLSVHFPPPYNPSAITSFSAFLAQHPFLSSLSITGGSGGGGDPLVVAVALSCPNLRRFRFGCSQVSPVTLCSLSTYCINLDSIAVTIARPLSFNWLPFFTSLKNLSLSIQSPCSQFITNPEISQVQDITFNSGLNLESLCLSGISSGDYGISYLWKNCEKVHKLQLMNCDSLGDFPGFIRLLTCLKQLELRTCRSIIDMVLLKLSESSVSLESLSVYDGGSRDGLLHFINHSKCNLRHLDLRLPLDLDNTHLTALSENSNFLGLSSLRLQSCCFVTGEGLKAVGRALGNVLEELGLINCDVVGREPGLLTALGQSLKRLRKLDLSYNDTLIDKELVLMLASCDCLVEVKLKGCNRLTDMAIGSMIRSCKKLQCVDISCCSGIQVDGVEYFVRNLPRLRWLEVEGHKLSETAKAWAANKFIEIRIS